MKRFKNLYPSIYDFQNLLLAARKAQRGKRFRNDVAQFNLNLEKELLRIQRDLIDKTYRHGAYRQFAIHEGKRRIISSAPYRDRVVHHALCNIIEPIFERSFIYDSYACRKGKGTHAAVDRLTHFCRKNRYALKIDVQKYFSNIHHEILFSQLKTKIGDPNVVWLIGEILRSYQDLREVDKNENYLFQMDGEVGIPIGNLTSQFFANVYLDSFDRYVKESLRCKAYIRYVDDFVILSNSKRELNDVRIHARAFLQENLRLSIHENRAHAFPVEQGIDFLGYRVFGTHRRIRDGNGYRFLKRFYTIKREYGRKEKSFHDVTQSIASWIGHVSHADSWRLRTALLSKAVL